MVYLGQHQVEETWGSFCCVTWTYLSELAKLIEQLVTAEGGDLPPAAFPSLTVTTVWSLNMAIQQQQKVQLKKLVFCKPVGVGHIKKELDEHSAGDKRKRRVAGEEQKYLLASHELSGGLSSIILVAFWEVGAFTEVQQGFWFSCHGLLRPNKAAWYAGSGFLFLCLDSCIAFEYGSQGLWN